MSETEEDIISYIAGKNTDQKLVDICFSIGFAVNENQYHFNRMTREDFGEWIAIQLRECGYDTEPVGSSWGVLKNGSI